MEKKNFLKIFIFVLLAAFLAGNTALSRDFDKFNPPAATPIIAPTTSHAKTSQEEAKQLKKSFENLAKSYEEFLSLFQEKFYRDLTEADQERIKKIHYEMLDRLARALHPHSAYMTYEEFKERTANPDFFGVGIQVQAAGKANVKEKYWQVIKDHAPYIDFENDNPVEFIDLLDELKKYLIKNEPGFKELTEQYENGTLGQDGLEIVNIIPGSSADQSGWSVYKNWMIIEAGGQALSGMKMKDAINLIRGPENTSVELLLLSPDHKETVSVIITRKKVSGCGLESRLISGSKLRYITFSQFNFQGKSRYDLVKCLSKPIDNHEQGLILDLRGNGGGLLTNALIVLDVLVKPGSPTLVVKEKDNKRVFVSRSLRHYEGPIVVLVDGHSASASELVAATLRDYGATMMGENSYGKGSVQTFELLVEGVAKYTNATFHAPLSDFCPDNGGIKVDIKVKDDPNTPGDEAIERAVEYLKNKTSNKNK